MYFEEREIKGVLSWRNSPDGDWKQFTQEQLTAKLYRLENEYRQLKYQLERLNKAIGE